MKEFTYTIKDALGIHARPAALLIKEAGAFSSDITIETNGKKANAKKTFEVMGLGIKQGDTVTVTATGSDEAEASAALEAFFSASL